MIESAYRTLKVKRDASPDEVRSAYVRLVRRYPPEHFPERFSAIQSAYRLLCLDDEFTGAIGDRLLKSGSDVEAAGILWGDREDLLPVGSDDMRDLLGLIGRARRAKELDALLTSISKSGILWRGPEPVNMTHEKNDA